MNRFAYLKSTLAVALIQVVSAGFIFVGSIILARILGPSQFGAYDFADVWIEILLFIALMGFDRLIILRVAIYFEKHDWASLLGIVQFTRRTSLLLTLLIIEAQTQWRYDDPRE